MRRRALIALLPAVLGAGCGYHVAGRADALPRSLRTIAVPAFGNATTRYRLTDQMANAVAREFLARTRYRVVTDEAEADAVLRGAVLNVQTYPVVFDPISGRAGGLQMHVTVQFSLAERTTGKVLYNRPALEFRQRYEVNSTNETSADPLTQNIYFDESDMALTRVSQDVARTIVSAILELF